MILKIVKLSGFLELLVFKRVIKEKVKTLFSVTARVMAMTTVTVKVSASPAYARESQLVRAITNNVLVRMIITPFAHLCEGIQH